MAWWDAAFPELLFDQTLPIVRIPDVTLGERLAVSRIVPHGDAIADHGPEVPKKNGPMRNNLIGLIRIAAGG
jgi:hypothetical protein